MSDDVDKEIISKLDSISKSLEKIANSVSVFKVLVMALFIALLIVIVGNYMP